MSQAIIRKAWRDSAIARCHNFLAVPRCISRLPGKPFKLVTFEGWRDDGLLVVIGTLNGHGDRVEVYREQPALQPPKVKRKRGELYGHYSEGDDAI